MGDDDVVGEDMTDEERESPDKCGPGHDTVSFDDLEPATGDPEPLQLETLAPLPTVPPMLPPGGAQPHTEPPVAADAAAGVKAPSSGPRLRSRRSRLSGRRSREEPRQEEEPELAPIALAPLEIADMPAPPPAAEMHLSPRYEYTSLPADDPPALGVLVEMEALGRPLVDKSAGPVAHVILALDMSASMNDPDKYPVLREAVGAMLDDLHAEDAADVLLSVVIFSKGADVIMRDARARKVKKRALFSALDRHPLAFGKYTDIAGALGRAGRIAYDQCRRSRTLPVRVYLLTDGRPQDVPRAAEMAQRLSRIPADLHALAFGADADVVILQNLFAGKRGGTVKSVRKETISTAFERVAEVAQRVIATRCIVSVDLALGVVGGDAFRYRPARVRFPEPAFEKGKHFRADLGTIEADRKYSLLFELRPPERDEPVTKLGTVDVSIPGIGGPITTTLELTLPRTGVGSEPGDVEVSVRTALDILVALNDDDPHVALRALRLRRDLYERERRDPGLIRVISDAIMVLERDGSLDALAAGDLATLRAHTCTSSGDTDLAYLRG